MLLKQQELLCWIAVRAACGICCTCTAWHVSGRGSCALSSHGLQQLHVPYSSESSNMEPSLPIKAGMQRRAVCGSQGFSCKQVVCVYRVEASQSAELHRSCMLTPTAAGAKVMGCSN